MSTTSTDAEHLRLLSVFHYIAAGLTALFALLPLIHLAIGIGLVSGAIDGKPGDGAEVVGWIFIAFAIVWITFGFVLAACMAYAGKCLKVRRNYKFCLVVACVSGVFFMPIGTILGVFTIIVLMRPTVRSAFDAPLVGSRGV